MEGGPASLGDRKSHPSFWSWKRCAEPCCCLQVPSLLLISHTPPLPPSASFPPISGTFFPSPSVSLFFFPQSLSVSCFPPGPPCLRFCLCSQFPVVLFHSLVPIQTPLLESLPTSVGGHSTHFGKFRSSGQSSLQKVPLLTTGGPCLGPLLSLPLSRGFRLGSGPWR